MGSWRGSTCSAPKCSSATERQRATAARNELEKAKLQLARLIGLPLGQPFTLATELAPVNIPEMTLEQAVERAYRTRPDYLAALERVKAAEAARGGGHRRNAAVRARQRELRGLLASPSPIATPPTPSPARVDIPIFQGGRARGRRLEAETDLRRRRTDADDLKGAIYYEVRTAMLDLQTGNEQLEVASRGRMLAASELTQARDRFAAGVAGNIEVVQAQAAVTLADDQYISALFTTSLAKGSLVRAVGIAEETAREDLWRPPLMADQPQSTSFTSQPRFRIAVAVVLVAVVGRRRVVLADRRPRVDRRCPGGCACDADRGARRRHRARVAGRRQPARRSGHRARAARSAGLRNRRRQGARRARRCRGLGARRPERRAGHIGDDRGQPVHGAGLGRTNRRRASTRHRRSSSRRARAWSRRGRGSARWKPTPREPPATSSGCAVCSPRTKSRSNNSTRRWRPPTLSAPRSNPRSP